VRLLVDDEVVMVIGMMVGSGGGFLMGIGCFFW